MKVTREMKIEEVLEMGEEKVLNTLATLSTNFERLRHTRLRRAMSGRVTVEQAAKVARVPLTEMLYVLNLTLGEDEETLSKELFASDLDDFEYPETDPPEKPDEIANVDESDKKRVRYIDLMPFHEAKYDPLPVILKGWKNLKKEQNILLIKHPFDPIPLRELFLRRFEMASWAEERKPGEWFIYFYRPFATAKAAVYPPIGNKVFLKTFAASG